MELGNEKQIQRWFEKLTEYKERKEKYDFGQCQMDIATLIPMLNEMKSQLGRKYTNIIADSGYESEENYLYLEKQEQIPYIKSQTYEKWKKKSFHKDISKRENMIYDETRDCYTCHNKKELKPIGITHRKSAAGYHSEIKIYEEKPV